MGKLLRVVPLIRVPQALIVLVVSPRNALLEHTRWLGRRLAHHAEMDMYALLGLSVKLGKLLRVVPLSCAPQALLVVVVAPRSALLERIL